jgi:uncharacterized protein (TIGR02996 family)
MNDEDAFLRAILAAPTDNLPKLVYADWLEEHAQPDKAAFIRAVVADAKSRPVRNWWGTPHERIGRAWYDLYTGAVQLWDTPTLLALGRLQGLLDGLAAGNNHTANIEFHFSAGLHPHAGELGPFVATLYRWARRGEPVLTPLDDWRTTLRAEIARWVGMEQGTASPRAVVRRSHQTWEGCAGTADRVLQLVMEVVTPEQGWRIDPPPEQLWGIDSSHFLLTGTGRALHLTFEFDD